VQLFEGVLLIIKVFSHNINKESNFKIVLVNSRLYCSNVRERIFYLDLDFGVNSLLSLNVLLLLLLQLSGIIT